MGVRVSSSPAAPAGVSVFRSLRCLLTESDGPCDASLFPTLSERPRHLRPFPPSDRPSHPERREPKAGTSQVVFILGGARSGKSHQALVLARRFEGPKVFIATAQALDVEMEARIERHRQERGDDWRTIEEPLHLEKALRAEAGRAGVVVVDCLTLWLANLPERVPPPDDTAIEAVVQEVGQILAARLFHAIVVSNEIGLGIVPADPSVRRYRDLLGSVNQHLAARADRIVLMVAGYPIAVREGGIDAEP